MLEKNQTYIFKIHTVTKELNAHESLKNSPLAVFSRQGVASGKFFWQL
jgi:hypothetical protein